LSSDQDQQKVTEFIVPLGPGGVRKEELDVINESNSSSELHPDSII